MAAGLVTLDGKTLTPENLVRLQNFETKIELSEEVKILRRMPR